MIRTYLQLQDYSHETEFSQQLSDYLHGKTITTRFIDDRARVRTLHDTARADDRNRPDIQIHQSSEIRLQDSKENLHLVSTPFFIECKPSTLEVRKNQLQYLRYKYEPGSDAFQNLNQRGDYHVAVTCPEFLEPDFQSRDFDSGYINPAQLIRTLWDIGVGAFYRTHNGYKIAFNEQEVMSFEDF